MDADPGEKRMEPMKQKLSGRNILPIIGCS